MFVDRRSLVRLALAALGLAMFCLFAFLGLGWVVRDHYDWLDKVVRNSESETRLWIWYGHAAAGFAPWDSDGDGYSDGLEFWLETDARKPTSRPDVNPWLASQWEGLTPFCREWSHWKSKPHIDGFVFGWVPGTQISVSANHPAIVFRKKSGDPESPTLTITANANGELVFDVCFTAAVVRDVSSDESPQVLFMDPKSGDKFCNRLPEVYGWRGPTVPATLCDVYEVPLSAPPNPDLNNYILRPAGWERVAWFLVERRRKGSGKGFEGYAALAPDKGPAYLIRSEWMEEGSSLGDYDWQIATALKAPP